MLVHCSIIGFGNFLVQTFVKHLTVFVCRVPVRLLHADCDPLTPMGGAEALVRDAHAAGKMDVNLVR